MCFPLPSAWLVCQTVSWLCPRFGCDRPHSSAGLHKDPSLCGTTSTFSVWGFVMLILFQGSWAGPAGSPRSHKLPWISVFSRWCEVLHYLTYSSAWLRRCFVAMLIVQWFMCVCWDLEKVDCWKHNSHRWGKNILSRKILHAPVLAYVPWQQNQIQKWVPDGCGNWQETNAEADLEKTDWGHQRWKRGLGGPDKVDNTWYIIFGAFQGRTVRWTICSWAADSGRWKGSCCGCSASALKVKPCRNDPISMHKSLQSLLPCKAAGIMQITHCQIAPVSFTCSLKKVCTSSLLSCIFLV